MSYLKKILFLLNRDTRRVPVIFLLFLTGAMLDVVGLGLVGGFISLVVNPDVIDDWVANRLIFRSVLEKGTDPMLLVGIALVGVFALKAIVGIAINYAIVRFAQRQQVRLRCLLMNAFQGQPYLKHIRRDSSEYVYAIGNLTAIFSSTVVLNLLRTLSDGLVALALFVLLAWINPLALILLLTLICLTIFSYDWFFRGPLGSYGKRANISSNKMLQAIKEGIEGMREIRISGKEQYFLSRMALEARTIAKARIFEYTAQVIPRYMLESMVVLFVVIVVLVVSSHGIPVDDMIVDLGVFGFASLRLIPAGNVVASSISRLRFSRDSVNRLYEEVQGLEESLFNWPDKQDQAVVTEEMHFDTVELSDVSARYPEASAMALHNISLTIRRREAVGIEGPSGAGKSTLVNVLLGLMDLEEGEIRVNGKRLASCRDQWWRQIAYIPQEPFLLNDSLANNIALGDPSETVNEKKVMDCINRVSLDDVIASLPEGIHTRIGEKGLLLSGGQIPKCM